MLPDQSTGIAAMGASLRTEAGGVGGKFNGQVVLFQGIIAEDVGNRDLGGLNHVEVPALDPKKIFLKFWQLAGGGHGS